MAAASVPAPDREPDDLTATLWRDDAALAARPLTRATALDYFAGSPFYDRACNNELLRARGLGMDSLSLMPAGPEFVLADAQEPHLYVVRRQLRGAPGAAPVPQAVYYILDGSVYQAPTLEAVLSARLSRCLWSMRTAFQRMQDDLDPLKRAAREAAAPGAAAGPPPRRYSDAERDRARTGDRIVSTVLGGLLPQGAGGGGGGGGGAAEGAGSAAGGPAAAGGPGAAEVSQ